MNVTRHYTIVFFSLLSLSCSAQAEIFAPMKDAIKTGSARELVKYFNQPVDIDLDGEERTYSKIQAELVLREFFKKHAVTDFNIIHNGKSSKGSLQFAIGKYTSEGQNYTVLMRVKDVETQHLIYEIKFQKE